MHCQIDESVGMRESARPYAVIEYPYQADPFVHSTHDSLVAAVKRARTARRNFARLYPDGYGIRYAVQRVRDGAEWDELGQEWIEPGRSTDGRRPVRH